IAIAAERFVQSWLIPCCAAGAVIIGSWLVEAKQSVIENMAPVLTRIFTPLFAIMMVTFLCAMLLTGRGVGIQREDVPLGIDDAQAFGERAEDGVERAAFVDGRSRVGRRKFSAFGLRVARVGRGLPGRAPHALPELLQEPTHCHDLSVRWCIMPPTVLTG
ncbi:MAG: hypothetical protein KAX87_03060, partial [Nitrospira sp.]|nr:hypothetical protein [Nitrospira sp.]